MKEASSFTRDAGTVAENRCQSSHENIQKCLPDRAHGRIASQYQSVEPECAEAREGGIQYF